VVVVVLTQDFRFGIFSFGGGGGEGATFRDKHPIFRPPASLAVEKSQKFAVFPRKFVQF
jgi:hypothetical protein